MGTVRFENVSKRWPSGEIAVDRLSLDLHDGEFLVVVGPSGCGKTTLLRMLAGLEDISGGSIEISGRTVNEVPPKDRDVAMVFQNYALYPHMTVRGNLAFGMKLRGTPRKRIDEKIVWASELLGIETLLDRKPAALSGGQRQRIALGRALVREPAVFLFDEPLSNLDAKLRIQTRTELRQLHGRVGITSMFVTHDQEEAMTLGDRVAVMNAGQLQQCDTPATVYQRPANRFVAEFLGSPAINLCPGELHEERGTLFVNATGWRLPLTPEQTIAVNEQNPQRVLIGIRPEHVQVGTAKPDSSVTFSIDVEGIEWLGPDQIVFARFPDGTLLRIRAESSIDLSTKTLTVGIPSERCLLFVDDAEGRRLRTPSETGKLG